jgi:hypothetical protein
MRVTVYNKKGEKISRGRHGYPSEKTVTYIINESEYKLIKAARHLNILKVELECPICHKFFDNEKALRMHHTRVHKGE